MALPLFEKKSIHERVVQQFIDAVIAGEMAVGQKLPSEVQLAAEFQISRNILREALKTLKVMGVIENAHGKGTFIAENARQRIASLDYIEALAADQTVMDLFEVRIVIEPGLAQFAAERRTAEDIEKLWAAADKLFTTNSVEESFHQIVAEASRCTVLCKYLNSIFRQLRFSDYGAFVDQLSKAQMEEELQEHRKIIECIIDHDGKGARNLMYTHLTSRLEFIQLYQKNSAAKV